MARAVHSNRASQANQVVQSNEELLREVEQLRARVEELENERQREVAGSGDHRSLSDLLLELHIEHSPLGIVEWDRELRVRLWSQRSEELFGWSPDEVLGKRFDELDLVHPDDHERVSEILSELRSGNASFNTHTYKSKHRSGDTLHCQWFHSAIRNSRGKFLSLISLALDVTDRFHAEAALEETRAILTAAIDASPAGIIIADVPDGRIRMVNAAALGMRKTSREELTEIPIELHPTRWKCFHPDGTPFHPEELPLSRAVRKGEVSTNVDVVIERSDGNRQWVLGNAAPVRNTEGQIIGGVVVFPDVTEQKQAAAAIRKMESELTRVARVWTMGELVGGIAHEMNQPLYAIQNFSKASIALLEGGTELDRPRLTDWLDKTAEAAEHAGQVLVRLRDFVSKRETKITDVDLQDIVNRALSLMQHEAQQKKIAFQINLPDNLMRVRADAIQIQQVIAHLLQNSIEAIPESSDCRQIEISAKNVENEIRVTISDSGKGLPEDWGSEMFQAFSSTKPEGLGLGLAISKSILESHDGELWATEEIAQGAEFNFTLVAAG